MQAGLCQPGNAKPDTPNLEVSEITSANTNNDGAHPVLSKDQWPGRTPENSILVSVPWLILQSQRCRLRQMCIILHLTAIVNVTAPQTCR